ncbi:MAG: T9SS type A sorting domain-containing protein [Candidatus Pacebacteria bacterium]|nr:T9SS type A sorting domain-containing protein [Candidatus Paceibacterota bacterium]
MKQLFLFVVFCITFSNLSAQTFQDTQLYSENPSVGGVYSLEYGDINNDGDVDLLITRATPSGFNVVTWQENLGGGTFSSTQNVIRTSPIGGTGEMRGAKFIQANPGQDNNVDIIVAEYTTENMILYLGNGDGTFQPPTILDVFNFLPPAFGVVDFNNDGLEDIIFGDDDPFSPSLYWYENTGSGNFNPATFLTSSGFTQDIEFGLVDNDSHVDIIITSPNASSGGSIQYYRGDSSGGIIGGSVLITLPTIIPNEIIFNDFNNDGDPDIAYGSFSGNQFAWYSGDGTGTFSHEQTISESNSVVGLSYGDINNDNFDDISYAVSGTSEKIVYLMNNAGNSFMDSDVSTSIDSPRFTQIFDLDNDGDGDIVSLADEDYVLTWHETILTIDNDGDGVFTPDDIDDNDPFVCRDLDNDGCDDCSQTGADGSGGDVNNDGTDTDGDGDCDAGDTDDDNDGNPDTTDPNPLVASTSPDSIGIEEGATGTINVLSNDDFLPGANTSLVDAGTGSAGGTIVFDNITGELDYTPASGEAGTSVTVDYTVCHTPTGVCGTNTVTITVTNCPDNDGDGDCDDTDPDDDNDGNPDTTDPNPLVVVTNSDSGTTPEDQNIVINVLSNDDFLPGTNTSLVDAGTGSAGGTISFDNMTGEMSYLPNTGEAGSTVTIVYTVCNTPTGVCATETVSVMVDQPLSVDDFENNLFKVYPNPAVSQITIDTNEILDEYQVINMLGQVVTKGSLRDSKVVDVSSLPRGMYMLHIKGDTKQGMIKFIKN